jgi:hypothetical protein
MNSAWKLTFDEHGLSTVLRAWWCKQRYENVTADRSVFTHVCCAFSSYSLIVYIHFVCVCGSICMYVCMYACIYVLLFLHKHARTCKNTHIRAQTYISDIIRALTICLVQTRCMTRAIQSLRELTGCGALCFTKPRQSPRAWPYSSVW